MYDRRACSAAALRGLVGSEASERAAWSAPDSSGACLEHSDRPTSSYLIPDVLGCSGRGETLDDPLRNPLCLPTHNQDKRTILPCLDTMGEVCSKHCSSPLGKRETSCPFY